MSAAAVVMVRTGAANTASVVAAFGRLGAAVELTTEAEVVERAGLLVLPGVGAFGPVAGRLAELGLVEVLRRRFRDERPTLAICLGMQLLAAASDESPGVDGLGVLPVTARRFPGHLRVPQLGWNRVRAADGCQLLGDGAAYFANSYCLTEAPAGWSAGTADHGGRFVAALERGPLLACQFHPELSGAWGQDLLARWLACGRGGPC
jgi:imidazole glycerol phosphate synthase glutamine amidotransferase subunit